MGFLEIWLLFGLVGWTTLMLYRIFTDGLPVGISFISYVRGFVASLAIGPLCFAFLIYLLIFGDR